MKIYTINIFDESGAQIILDNLTHEEVQQFERDKADSDLSYAVERRDSHRV